MESARSLKTDKRITQFFIQIYGHQIHITDNKYVHIKVAHNQESVVLTGNTNSTRFLKISGEIMNDM